MLRTHDAYIDRLLTRKQKIHDLVRRNTHQAKLRQKVKYDRAIRTWAYQLVRLYGSFVLHSAKRLTQVDVCLA